MGSTLLEFEKRPWPETMKIGQKYGHDRLSGDGLVLPPFDDFNAKLDEIKIMYRDRAKESLDEWVITAAFEEYLRLEKIDGPEENAAILTTEFYRAVRDIVAPLAGVRETLEQLSNRGIKMGMISNTIFPPDEHDADLQEFGIKEFLPNRIYSCAFGCRKPRKEIYLAGLEQMGLPAESVAFVGDRYIEDVQGPQSVGMKGVLRYCHLREYPDPMPNGFRVIHELPELLEIID